MTEVMGALHSRGDMGLKRGQVTVLVIELGHCLMREDTDRVNEGKLRGSIMKVAWAPLQLKMYSITQFAVRRCKGLHFHGQTLRVCMCRTTIYTLSLTIIIGQKETLAML